MTAQKVQPRFKLYNKSSSLIPSEYDECKLFVEWAKFIPHIHNFLIKHVNEGKRSPKAAIFLKRVGMRPGLPDYQLPIPNKKYCGLWLEMKRRDGRNKPKNVLQDLWLAKLSKIGHYATYVYGWEDAAQVVKDYLSNKL